MKTEEVCNVICTSNHLIAYLDLLGCKKSIINEEDNEILLKIYEWYNFFKCEARFRRLYEPERKVKIFSDNIIVAEEINFKRFDDDQIRKICESFLRMIRTFQFVLMTCGWYVRGSVEVGSLYIDETFVWGKSLITAYMLESQKAIYPRVLISDNFAQEISVCIDDLIDKKFIALDSDGQIYVDYFNFEGDDGGRFPVLLEQIRNSIMWSYQKSNHDARVQKKIQWVIEKFNQECLRSDRESYLIRDII